MFIKYVLCSRHPAKLVTCIISFKVQKIPQGRMNIIYMILIKKLGIRKFESFAQDCPNKMTYTIPFKFCGVLWGDVSGHQIIWNLLIEI